MSKSRFPSERDLLYLLAGYSGLMTMYMFVDQFRRHRKQQKKEDRRQEKQKLEEQRHLELLQARTNVSADVEVGNDKEVQLGSRNRLCALI